PAAAHRFWIGSIISSALFRVNRLSSSKEERKRRSSNWTTSNSLATSSASRTQAAIVSWRVLNLRVCRYATAEAFHTAFLLSGEATPKKLSSIAASVGPSAKKNFSLFMSLSGKFAAHSFHCEVLASSRRRASASSNWRCKLSQKCAGL